MYKAIRLFLEALKTEPTSIPFSKQCVVGRSGRYLRRSTLCDCSPLFVGPRVLIKNKISRITMIAFTNHASTTCLAMSMILVSRIRWSDWTLDLRRMFAATASLFEQICPRTMSHTHLVKRPPRPFLEVQALPVAPPAPQMRVCSSISDWLQQVPIISFIEIVEPLEDTRCELTFAGSPSSHSRSTDSADLDEVEARQPPRLNSTQLAWVWH